MLKSRLNSDTTIPFSDRPTLSARTTRASHLFAVLVILASACSSPTGSEPPLPTDLVTIDVAKAAFTPVAQASYIRIEIQLHVKNNSTVKAGLSLCSLRIAAVGAGGTNEATAFQNECDRNIIGDTLAAGEEKTLTFDFPIPSVLSSSNSYRIGFIIFPGPVFRRGKEYQSSDFQFVQVTGNLLFADLRSKRIFAQNRRSWLGLTDNSKAKARFISEE
jgi:hypothetical protein